MNHRWIDDPVLKIENVTMRFGDAPPLLDHVTWRLGPGDRYGVVGVNGAGKTTLLRLLSGTQDPTSGRVKRGKTVQTAELTQDVEDLDELADLRVVEVVEREKRTVVAGGKELTAAQLVERLGFTKDRARTPVRDLSGGERRRLQLLRLLVGEPNVLLLDEPTNDLDTDTLAALEDLLDGWPGTLIVVSHDRYLLERVCDRQVALLGDGTIRDLPGGVEQYLELRRTAIADESGAARAATSAPSPRPATVDDRSGDAGPTSAAGARASRKELQRIERRLQLLARKETDLHERMVGVADDYVKLGALEVELRAVHDERSTLEERWLEVAEED